MEDGTTQWYLMALGGDMVLRVRPGMPLGETSDGELSFAWSCAQLEFDIADDGGLVVSAVGDHALELNGGACNRRAHLARDRRPEVRLLHNVLRLVTDFVDTGDPNEIVQIRSLRPADVVAEAPAPVHRPALFADPVVELPLRDATDVVPPVPERTAGPLADRAAELLAAADDVALAARRARESMVSIDVPVPVEIMVPNDLVPPHAVASADPVGPADWVDAAPPPKAPAPDVPRDVAAPVDEPVGELTQALHTEWTGTPPPRHRASPLFSAARSSSVATLLGLGSLAFALLYSVYPAPDAVVQPAVVDAAPAPPRALAQATPAVVTTTTPADDAAAPVVSVPVRAVAEARPPSETRQPVTPPPNAAPLARPIAQAPLARPIAQAPPPRPPAPARSAPRPDAAGRSADVVAPATSDATIENAEAGNIEVVTGADAGVAPSEVAVAATAVATVAEEPPVVREPQVAVATAPEAPGDAYRSAPTAEERVVEAREPSPQSPTVDIARALFAADQALAQGRLVSPPEANAFALYTRVLTLDPTSDEARAGLLSVRRGLINRALAQLASGALADARLSLNAAADAGADASLISNLRNEVEYRQRLIDNRSAQVTSQAEEPR